MQRHNYTDLANSSQLPVFEDKIYKYSPFIELAILICLIVIASCTYLIIIIISLCKDYQKIKKFRKIAIYSENNTLQPPSYSTIMENYDENCPKYENIY